MRHWSFVIDESKGSHRRATSHDGEMSVLRSLKWQAVGLARVARDPMTLETRQRILQESTWADGLRGIAAVFVMSSHMVLCFCRNLIPPSISTDGPSRLFQRPILRLIGQGHAAVALFVIMSGFVLALKPLKLAQSGQVEKAVLNLSSSAFRRPLRLFLPSLATTVLNWFVCQLGAFETGRVSDTYWLAVTSPPPSSSWGTAVDELAEAVRNTWLFNPENRFDQPQWAMLYLLHCSMIGFAALLILVNMTKKSRVATTILLWCWGWNWDLKIGSPYGAVGVFGGILLAELHYSDIPLQLSSYSLYYTPPLLITALVLMSFPPQFQDQIRWTRTLLVWHYKIFPETAFVDRTWPTMGALLLVLTIVISPHLRQGLSHRYFLWLGKVSFAIYLLHGLFMRSVLAWMVFAGQSLKEYKEEENGQPMITFKYPLPRKAAFTFIMPIFFAILGVAVNAWVTKVEPLIGNLAKSIEDVLSGMASSKGSGLPKPVVLPTQQERQD